ncbi:MAG: hypothetical protein M3178_05340 [Pseudomonadota bacterium]|nr:hypothetical protein [Pseudomonadota bacterium]
MEWPAEGCLSGAIRAAAAPRCACQVSIETINKHLAQTSGRMRRRQGHRPVDPRRCRLAPLVPPGKDKSPYRKLTSDFVRIETFGPHEFIRVERESLRLLAEQAMRDINHL